MARTLLNYKIKKLYGQLKLITLLLYFHYEEIEKNNYFTSAIKTKNVILEIYSQYLASHQTHKGYFEGANGEKEPIWEVKMAFVSYIVGLSPNCALA